MEITQHLAPEQFQYEFPPKSRIMAIEANDDDQEEFSFFDECSFTSNSTAAYSNILYEEDEEEEEKSKFGVNDDITFNENAEMDDLSSNFTQKVSLTKRLVLSSNQLTELTRESMKFTDDIPGTILLDHNMFTVFPTNLALISNFIVHLDLMHNHLTSFDLTMKDVTFTSLKVLKLSNNRLKSLEYTLGMAPSFPKLEELILDHNALTVLPENLQTALPSLKILSVSSNKLDNITDQSFGQCLEVLILSNNDIGYLPPGLSTLKNLKELVVFGNR